MSEFNLFETPSNPPQPGLALARKWRPRDFSTLVGQNHVVQALSHALDQNRLHHAWLFTGTRGVGKTTIARILAKSLNCIGTPDQPIHQPTSKPCGVCQTCLEIDAGRFIDYIEMDAASNRGVDDMAALLEKSVYGPTSGRFKVFMIDEVHMLSNHAFNSMLKTLEEPPAHLKFILATTDPQKIPVTVLSRCLQFNLKQMPSVLIVSHLQDILEKEQLSAQENALRIIAKAARGSMRDALSLTDQAIAYTSAYTSGQITEELVRNMLGTLDDAYLIRILEALKTGNGQELVDIAREMASMSMSFSMALQDLSALLQKIAMAQVIPHSVLEEWPEAQAVLNMASAFSKEEIQLLYQIAITSRADLPLAPEEEVGFLMALLRMLAFKMDDGQSSQSNQSNQSGQSSTGQGTSTVPTPSSAKRATTLSPSVTDSPPLRSSVVKPLSNGMPANRTADSVDQKKTLVQDNLSKAHSDDDLSLNYVSDNPPPVTDSHQPVDVSFESFNTADPLSPAQWQSLIKQLSLKGLVGQFAFQTALSSWADKGDYIQIQLTSELPQLATPFSLQKLTEGLEVKLGKVCRIKVDGGQSDHTVEKMEAKDQAHHQTEVNASMIKDPFLQDMQKIMGVKVVEGSIRPLNDSITNL